MGTVASEGATVSPLWDSSYISAWRLEQSLRPQVVVVVVVVGQCQCEPAKEQTGLGCEVDDLKKSGGLPEGGGLHLEGKRKSGHLSRCDF